MENSFWKIAPQGWESWPEWMRFLGKIVILFQEQIHINGLSQNHSWNTDTILSSTWCEFDPNTAYVVCISICPYFLIWYPYAPTSLYGNTAHCSGYGVAMGCYRLCIVPRTAIVTSQWYDRYCFTEYARTWARHPTTPWQRECTAITDFQSIDSL